MARARVKKVLDGNTLVIMNNTKIRVANLHSPNINQRGGRVAMQRMSKMIKGKQIGISKELFCSRSSSIRRVTLRGKPINRLMEK